MRAMFGEDVATLPRRLFSNLANTAPWTYQWVAWLVDALHRLEPCPGYASLRRRLTDPLWFDEACSVLQVAERLQQVGFELQIDREVEIRGHRRVPDLCLRDPATGVGFYGEVSVLFSADRFTAAWRAFERICEPALPRGPAPLISAGLILRDVAENEIDGLRNRVVWEMMEVRRDGKFREVVIDGTLVLALAPVAEQDQVIAWARQRDITPGGIGGVMPPIDHFTRLRQKLKLKVEQLPDGMPNLLVITAQDLFLQARDPRALIPIAAELLTGLSQLAVLVLHCAEGLPVTPGVEHHGPHTFAAGSYGGELQQYLIVRNTHCDVPMPNATLRRMQQAWNPWLNRA